MSETTIVYESGLALTIADHRDGGVGLTVTTQDGKTFDHYLRVPAEHRAAVALALLGGITDDLVERCARADYATTWGDDHWDEAKERVRIDHREHARAVRAAIGGGGEGRA